MKTMATLPISRPLTPLLLLLFNFKQVKNKKKKLPFLYFIIKIGWRVGMAFNFVVYGPPSNSVSSAMKL